MNPGPLPRVVLPFPETPFPETPLSEKPLPEKSGGGAKRWMALSAPRRILAARRVREVPELLREADAEVRRGRVAAGFVSYEAAPAFDSAQRVRSDDSDSGPDSGPDPFKIPLAWMMICDSPPAPSPLPPRGECVVGALRPAVAEAEYFAAVASIKKRIAAGDAYQVNLTYPLRARFAGDPLALFAELARAQFSPWMFFAETAEWAVCSASPECFFLRDGTRLESRPMKGTRPPEAAAELRRSEKERAENLMVVDMIRNDMSRIAGARGVRAGPLLQVETHPTVAQMTSSVKCEIPADAGLPEIFAALFPCASVTGAPKIAAMRTILELEKFPRGAYCGACGVALGERARFAVAIRTATVRKDSGTLQYGVGGGVVADSAAESELEETRVKASLFGRIPPALLIETMRAFNGVVGLRRRHLSRLSGSAARLGFRCDAKAIREAVKQAGRDFPDSRLRLTLDSAGAFEIESAPTPGRPASGLVRLGIAGAQVFSGDELLRHKTNRRAVYDSALAEAKARGRDDAILQNERGELTETCVANLAARIGGRLLTPAAECGLLPGVLRAEMLARGELREAKLLPEDLRRAEAIFRLNAVRGLEVAELAD